MRCLVAVVVVVLGCTPKRGVTVKVKPEEPKLDIVAPWLDPDDFWPKGVPTKPRPLADALADPGTAPIVIRGATILTATGRRIDVAFVNGEVKLVHVTDQARGIFLEPNKRAATPPPVPPPGVAR